MTHPSCDCEHKDGKCCGHPSLTCAEKQAVRELYEATARAKDCLTSLDYLLANQNPDVDWDGVRALGFTLEELINDDDDMRGLIKRLRIKESR